MSNGPRYMLRKGGKIFFLFFSAYLICSVLLVAFDHHPLTANTKTCTLCQLKKTLYSSDNRFPFFSQNDIIKVDIFRFEEPPVLFEGFVFYPCNTFRGPPFPRDGRYL